MRKIIHVDMDCFYAAVEMRDNPALRGIPLAIGGSPQRRGVIATCNYEARAFGVRSAMSSHKALSLCPNLTLIPGRMEVYKETSARIRDIFARFTDKIEPLSLDEAYLDVTDSRHCQGSATLIAMQIRQMIKDELGLTASAGVAPNKFLAKIASEENKPDGLFVLTPDQVPDFVRKLPLRKIPGVGQATEARLAQLGLKTGQDVLRRDLDWLLNKLGKFGAVLHERAQGIDERPVAVSRVRKSVGVETTLSEDVDGLAAVMAVADRLWPELKRRLGDRPIHKLGVKVKFSDFVQTTMEHSTAVLDKAMLEGLLAGALERGGGKKVRLVGLSVGLLDGNRSRQLPLDFDEGR
ncbi:DNA polymerase IV [Gallaecimonas sp. GXIMD4217]|uniref:DNA polymerase IV n=1 Tax=Gallaecimonas sp. GXIMD4217 TaxID=3131927 RepID=UPI00311AD89C